jgi:serine/threonine protein kinase
MQPKPASNTNLLALPEGTELVGDFRIKRVLGAGGFGITYLADEAALARLVTIKEYFPADFAARSSASEASPRSLGCAEDYKWGLERFLEEAQTLARFDHPNIVRVHRYFRANATGYMVLHWEEGHSFKSWLKNLKRAPRQADLDGIVAPLLDALEIIHKGNFLHRDIAPDNIIVRKDGSPVLIDFGSARGEIASHTKTVSALVKPGYSPYEQYATTSRQQGPWSDIYALGATLYHAISGKRPPDAPSRMVNDEYVSARQAALSSYRGTFLAAIDKALNLEVTERPQSIAEWRGALLAPESKAQGGRIGLRLPFGRTLGSKNAASQPPPDAVDAATVPLPESAKSLVPAPPDAPQARGQLLDFIEALKKKRTPILLPKRKSEPKRKAAKEPKAKPKAEPKPAPTVASVGEPSPSAQYGLGYGPAPASARNARPGSLQSAISALREPPRVLLPAEKRAPPKPRRISPWIPTKRWRSVIYKLLIGLGVAGFAAAYQDKLPHFEGRGASVVSSQVADMALLTKLNGHKGAVTGLATGDDGRWVVSAGADGAVRIWDAASGGLLRIIELDEGAPTALAVDERRALTGHKSGAIVLWDLERAEKLGVFQHGNGAIAALAFGTDPNRFLAASLDGAVLLFDIRSPATPSALVEGQDGASSQIVAASREAGIVVAAGDRSIKLFRSDARITSRSWRGQTAGVTALDIAPGGRSIASAGRDGTIRLWSTASSRQRRTIDTNDRRIAVLAFAPGERYLATASENGQLKLWDLRSGRAARTFSGSTGIVRALAFSSDGRRLLAAGEDGTVRIWNTVPPPAIN